TGTLGLTAARVPVTLSLGARDPSTSIAPVLLTRDDKATTNRVSQDGGASRAKVVMATTTPTGLSLRHDGELSGRADAPLRICAAAPLPRAFALDQGPIDLALLPRHEPLFGSGWHALEVAAGGGYFRWMNGPRATLTIPLRAAADVRIVLDAQGVRSPLEGDLVRLSMNGQALGDRALHPTRGLYEWDVTAATLHAGVNIVRLETTATIRPAETSPGADPRRLGLLVYGWRLVPGTAR
ncbi:MAG TPA: hypothetical protein VMF13_00660, partial [Luteitalea sp.]|nr:hypothetical protein [Luteitalea sp.]